MNTPDDDDVAECRRFLSFLTAVERRILELRFGFADGSQWDVEAVASSLGMTAEQVARIEEWSMSNLRNIAAAMRAGWKPRSIDPPVPPV